MQPSTHLKLAPERPARMIAVGRMFVVLFAVSCFFNMVVIAGEVSCMSGTQSGWCAPLEAEEWFCGGHGYDVGSGPECSSNPEQHNCHELDQVRTLIADKEAEYHAACSLPISVWNDGYEDYNSIYGVLNSVARRFSISLMAPDADGKCTREVTHSGARASCYRGVGCPAGYLFYGPAPDYKCIRFSPRPLERE